ncbi:MAG TPA: acylphosphatase [Gemmatimonadaceae bacterium]|nr:acylphosphatase [Gemmatimonadaceae bacterium]
MVAFRFRVTGRVQGVGFRWFTRAAADRAGVVGWVANEPDGSVTGEVRGESHAVERFLTEIQRGPAASAVTEVVRQTIASSSAGTEFTMFEIRR